MKIIQINENQKEEWNKFIAENCSESFLQAWEWGEFQKSLGKKIWRIGVVTDKPFSENKTNKFKIQNNKSQINSKFKIQNSQPKAGPPRAEKFIAVALIVKQNLPFGRSYFYCPRGPVVNEFEIWNLEFGIFKILFNEIKKISKEEKSLFLKFDPPADRWLHSPEGLWSPNTNHSQKGSIVPSPRELWSQHNKFNLKKSSNEVQPRDTLILDLTKSEEELLKEMKQKTRYNIRLSIKKGVKIKSRDADSSHLNSSHADSSHLDFEEFWKLVKETSARDKFKSHNENYYWKMLENLGELQKAPQSCGTMEPTSQPPFLKRENLQARLYFAEYENEIIVANIVLYFGDYCVYLHGASSSKYRNTMAPYLLQWQQILDAKKRGCKTYDFWGVVRQAHHDNKNSWQGITRFKKGFGGDEKNYIGAYDLVFNNIGYAIYKVGKFLK